MRKIVAPFIALCIVAVGFVVVNFLTSNNASPFYQTVVFYIASSLVGLAILFAIAYVIIKSAVRAGVSEALQENVQLFVHASAQTDSSVSDVKE